MAKVADSDKRALNEIKSQADFDLMARVYHQEDLDRFPEIGSNAPELWKKFMEYYSAAFQRQAWR